MSGVKRLNFLAKRGEVTYRMCSEHTHIDSPCCYWFSSTEQMKSAERKCCMEKKGEEEDGGVSERVFVPDRLAFYVRAGADI